MTFQVDAQLKTFSVVLHNFLYHFLWDFFNLLPDHRLQFLNCSVFFCENFCVQVSPKEKCNGQQGWRNGLAMNVSSNGNEETREHFFENFLRLTRRSPVLLENYLMISNGISFWFSKCSQHLRVTIRGYSCCLSNFLKEIRPPNAAVSNHAPHRDPFRMLRLLMQFSWIMFCPVWEVLFINCTRQIKIGLVACPNDIIRFRTDESKNFLQQLQRLAKSFSVNSCTT